MKINLNNLNLKQTNKFRELFESNKILYIKLIDDLYENSDKSLLFKLSSITSRDLYLNDLLIKLTEISLIQYYINNYKVEEIVVYDKYYKKLINKIKKGNTIKIVIVSKNYNYLKLMKNICRNLCYVLISISLKSNKRRQKYFSTKNLLLMTIPVVPSMFNDGIFHDRFYTGIEKYIKKKILFITLYLFPV